MIEKIKSSMEVIDLPVYLKCFKKVHDKERDPEFFVEEE